MTVLGIDPGLGGAVAVLTVEPAGSTGLDPRLEAALDRVDPAGAADRRRPVAPLLHVDATPVVWCRAGKGRRRRYHVPAMAALLRGVLPWVRLVYLEQQGARPLQGRSSIYTTGYGAGIWEGLLVVLEVPFRIVAPPTWRKAVGLGGADKAGVALAAGRRFPGVSVRADHTDAVMIAVAAALELGGDART